jgi:hypothetical protein
VEVLEAKQGDRRAIKQVSCDMSPAFIKGVKENMPEAEITFDKFHIISYDRRHPLSHSHCELAWLCIIELITLQTAV